MLAVAVNPAGDPVLRELPAPEAPPGGVLVQVRYCGLCGSDVEKLRPGSRATGRVLGHELAGTIVAGALPVGTRVAVAHHVPCGSCARCLAGHEPLCAAFTASALEPGGFCEQTAASAAHVAGCVLPLPEQVSDLAGTFVEPLACVLRGIEQLPPAGDVAVLGAGSVGLLAAQVLAAGGRQRVHVVDPDPARAARAAALGFAAPQPGRSVVGVFAAAGAAVADGVNLLDDGGTLVAFAAGGPSLVDLDAVYRRELTLRGVRSATPRHLRAALALLERGALAVEPLVDAVLPLRDFAEGLRRYRTREALKVVFAP